MGAEAYMARPRQALLGWSLLVEAMAWTGLCVRTAVGLWSVGGPNDYVLGSLMWILAAFPVLVSGVALVRRTSPSRLPIAVVLTCLALTLVLNIVLSSSVFFIGLGIEPSLGATARALSLAISGACALLGTGLLSALRSHRTAESTRR
jgi:hypothetical protein